MGLKPVFKPVCPVQGCTFELRYHVRDEQVHPDNWAMTAETYAHLNDPHAIITPQLQVVPLFVPEVVEEQLAA